MASHFSSIGFPIRDQSEFAALPDRVGPEAVPIESKHGIYWKWSSECGAELWLQANTDNEVIGIAPCFSGVSRIRVRLTARVSRPNDTAMEGAFHGWADPDDDKSESGAYPFVFDAIDADQYGALTLPSVVEARVAAFAHEVTVYPSIDAYNATQTGEIKFASQSFIPSGLFSPGGDATSPPESMAIFTGHVVAAEVKTNRLTGAKYYWAHVQTLGGSFDVVIDPELSEAQPVIGGVLSGSFWLCGRLAPH
jgi:hypothetical protein